MSIDRTVNVHNMIGLQVFICPSMYHLVRYKAELWASFLSRCSQTQAVCVDQIISAEIKSKTKINLCLAL